jgi:hypothetical protein
MKAEAQAIYNNPIVADAQSKNRVSFIRSLYTAPCCGVSLPSVPAAAPRRLVSSPVSASPRRKASRRLGLAARGQARRIPDRRSQEGSRAILWSRHGTNFTDRLPKVAEAVRSLAADSALIDGEAVTLRSPPPGLGALGGQCVETIRQRRKGGDCSRDAPARQRGLRA